MQVQSVVLQDQLLPHMWNAPWGQPALRRVRLHRCGPLQVPAGGLKELLLPRQVGLASGLVEQQPASDQNDPNPLSGSLHLGKWGVTQENGYEHFQARITALHACCCMTRWPAAVTAACCKPQPASMTGTCGSLRDNMGITQSTEGTNGLAKGRLLVAMVTCHAMTRPAYC
jgi:hypothetical protein